jgi:hypothetical protein
MKEQSTRRIIYYTKVDFRENRKHTLCLCAIFVVKPFKEREQNE